MFTFGSIEVKAEPEAVKPEPPKSWAALFNKPVKQEPIVSGGEVSDKAIAEQQSMLDYYNAAKKNVGGGQAKVAVSASSEELLRLKSMLVQKVLVLIVLGRYVGESGNRLDPGEFASTWAGEFWQYVLHECGM